MHDDPLLEALVTAIEEIERQMIDLVDVDHDHMGRQKPTIPVRDREFFSVLTDNGRSLRALVEIVEARRAG